MKQLILIFSAFLILIFLIGFVYAESDGYEKYNDSYKKSMTNKFKEKLRIHNGSLNISGKDITVRELSDEQKEIIANKINAKTGLNLTSEDIDNQTVLRAFLSNGRYARIKIMPDTASETALQRLRAKCEARNCSVELKEIGIGNTTKLAYEIKTEKSSKLFFLFNNKMIVKAEVDAETGEIISVKRPWWSFLAKEEDE